MPLLPSPAPSPTPSPAILELLAKLSPPAPAPNAPPAPAFLCPACERPSLSSARRRRQLSTSTATAVTALGPHIHRSHQHHRSKTSDNSYSSLIAAVPPKFEQSSDGFWHLATSWSFHGKTSLPKLLPTPTPTSTSAFPSIPTNVGFSTQTTDLDDDDGDNDDDHATSTIPYDDSIESSIIAVTSDYDAIKDSLPTGWTLPVQRTKFYSIPVIVVVSLILAILLSLVIAGCVLGHKARSGSHSEGRQSLKKILNEARARANAQKDISRTTTRSEVTVDTEGGDPELEILSDSEKMEKILKQVQKKEKMWDKWRNKNGKLSDLGLRRRKKKFMTVNSVITTTTTTTTTTPTVNHVTATIPDALPAIPVLSPTTPSTLPGRSGSTADLVPIPALLKASSSSPLPVGSLPQPSLPPPPPSSTSRRHPPAYRYGAIVNASSSVLQSHVNQPDVDGLDTTLKDSPSLGWNNSQNQLILEDDDNLRPEYRDPPPLLLHAFDLPHRAHVATDDKTVLEMMRKGVSEPQESANASTSAAIRILSSDSDHRPNVPIWVDESLEDFQDCMSVPDRDNDVKLPSSSKGQLYLPPLPPTDLHRHLERHYNIDIHYQSGDLPGQPSSPLPLPSLLYSSTSNLDLSSSSSLYLQPSAPTLEDTGEPYAHPSDQRRPSAPPLLSDEDDLATSSDEATDDREERRPRWDRETDLDASMTRTQSTPSINAVSGPPYSRSRRRRSLSASSTTTISGPSSANKRVSLPRDAPDTSLSHPANLLSHAYFPAQPGTNKDGPVPEFEQLVKLAHRLLCLTRGRRDFMAGMIMVHTGVQEVDSLVKHAAVGDYEGPFLISTERVPVRRLGLWICCRVSTMWCNLTRLWPGVSPVLV